MTLHVAAYIKANLQIDYTDPDPAWRKYAETIIAWTHLDRSRRRDVPEGDFAQEANASARKHQEQLDLFLCIFNSNWKRTGPGSIKHHCRLGCPCGCLSRDKLAELASSLFCQLILFGKPPIPALNRWLRCRETSKWYLNHGID